MPRTVRVQAADPLRSWRPGPRRRTLLDFGTAVTTQGGPDFVPPNARIAVFGKDGTRGVEPRAGMIIRDDWSRIFP